MLYTVIFTFLGFVTGYLISNKYRKKHSIYKDLRCFLEFYKLKISYCQVKITDIIKEYFKDKKQSIKDNLLQYYSSKNADEKLVIENFKFLSDQDYCDIIETLTSLGKFGKDEEMEHVNSILQAIKFKEEEYLIEYKKFASLYLKLCTLIGLIIGILLL